MIATLVTAVLLIAVDFNRDVRPILSNNCFQCHGPDAAVRRAGLRLDVRPPDMDRLGATLAFDFAFGSQGSGNGQFFVAHRVAARAAGNVVVLDLANHRVQVLDADGTSRPQTREPPAPLQ